MEIKIGDIRKIELLDVIDNISAINFKVGKKFAELTENIDKTKGRPQIKFTRLSDNKVFYIKESYLVKEDLVLNLKAVDMKNQPLTIWRDKSPNRNDFTLYNLSGTTTSGYNNTDKTLNFDGSNDYAMTNVPLIPSTGNFTIEIRFIHRGNQTWERLLNQWASGSSTRFGISIKDNRLFLQIGESYKQVNPYLTNGSTYILEIKRIETSFYVYINGVQTYTTTSFGSKAINQANTALCRTTHYSKTSLMNVIIYHRALSDAERLHNISVMKGDLNE